VKEPQIKILFKKYVEHQCSEQEVQQLLAYFQQEEHKQLLATLISEHFEAGETLDPDFLKNMHLSFDKTDDYFRSEILKEDLSKSTDRRWFRFLLYSAACAVLILGSTFLYWQDHRNPIAATAGSTLVLENGDIILLDSHVTTPHTLMETSHALLLQEGPDLLSIKAKENTSAEAAAELLTLNVGRGQHLQIRLSDGTRVMVNSLTTLRFPLQFETHARHLEVAGEGYFDVVSNPQRPLIVKTPDQVVKVYGTQFNIKNYGDDHEAQTTLFKGIVSIQKIADGKLLPEHMLKPGERAIIAKHTDSIQHEAIESAAGVLAWTNDEFSYDNATMMEIMKDFSRWYNVEVDWSTVPALRYHGTIPRHYSLEQALDLLRKTSNVQIQHQHNSITF